MTSWLCVPCWRRRFPYLRLAQTAVGMPVDRECSSCGNTTRSGLRG